MPIISNPAEVQGMDVLALNATPNARVVLTKCAITVYHQKMKRKSAANKMWKDGIRNPNRCHATK